jgi:hypothetical protein
MNESAQDRRSVEALRIVAVSRDEAWLGFTRKTLRRTDTVEVMHELDEISNHLSGSDNPVFLLISSELVPIKLGDLESRLEGLPTEKVCVLRAPQDEHHRVNDKHLRGVGILVEDRPDSQKAMRRLIKILIS